MSELEKYIPPQRGTMRTEIARALRELLGPNEVRRARKLAEKGEPLDDRQRSIVEGLGYVRRADIIRPEDLS